MKWLVVGLWLTITAVLCIISYENGASTAVVTADTIEVVKWDTIVQTKPIAVESKVMELRSYRVKLLGKINGSSNDSVFNADSAVVKLPIEQKVYGDSTYKAWVSGFDARLDSIKLFQPTKYITITTKQKPSRWNVGLQGGVGITPKGIQPYIGVGVSYKLF
jgi:hypothetical protein